MQVGKNPVKLHENDVTFSPRSLNLNFDVPRSRLPLNKIIECPVLPNFQIDEPSTNIIEKGDIAPDKVIEMPATANIIEKQAVRLIVIRRKKMKKHKRRKFLKKMKFILRKREQNKTIQKEKLFEAELNGIHQEALKFDAKEYVAERLKTLSKERLPNKWQGHVVSESMIRQFLKEKKEKEEHKHRLRRYRLKLD